MILWNLAKSSSSSRVDNLDWCAENCIKALKSCLKVETCGSYTLNRYSIFSNLKFSSWLRNGFSNCVQISPQITELKWCKRGHIENELKNEAKYICFRASIFYASEEKAGIQIWLEVGVTRQFSWLVNFLYLSTDCLPKSYIHIWQMSPQLSCGDTCQIWMWFNSSCVDFRKAKISVMLK